MVGKRFGGLLVNLIHDIAEVGRELATRKGKDILRVDTEK